MQLIKETRADFGAAFVKTYHHFDFTIEVVKAKPGVVHDTLQAWYYRVKRDSRRVAEGFTTFPKVQSLLTLEEVSDRMALYHSEVLPVPSYRGKIRTRLVEHYPKYNLTVMVDSIHFGDYVSPVDVYLYSVYPYGEMTDTGKSASAYVFPGQSQLSLKEVCDYVADYHRDLLKTKDEPPREDRPYMLAHGGYIEQARNLVWSHFYPKHPNRLELPDVYVVWFCKTLQNWKALVSTNAKDDRYYEVTYDGDNKCAYIYAYTKIENIRVTLEDGEDGLFGLS